MRLKGKIGLFCLRWSLHLAVAVLFLYYVLPRLCSGVQSTVSGILQ